jgi:uncharacterized phage-like protein YoqJ
MSNLVVCGTGHRPQRLIGGWNTYYMRELKRVTDLAMSALLYIKPDIVITGMALGWDSGLGFGASLVRNVEPDLKIHGYLPYTNYNANWNDKNKLMFEKLVDQLDELKVITTGEVTDFGKANIDRDIAMVDASDIVLALFDGTEAGGTFQTIKYAKSQGKTVLNLWDMYRLRADYVQK